MIRSFDYLRLLPEVEDEVMAALSRVLHSNALVLGPETEAFEQALASALGVSHCVGVTSGTTALHLALMGLGVGAGDEVITVANTCVPTVSAIRLVGARPVFVDVQESDLMIDPAQIRAAITPQTRCIVPVHLWGSAADMAAVLAIAREYDLLVVEDCAQAHGTLFHEQFVGTFGNAGCFSFYPTKNVGAYGDGGAIITNDDVLAARLRRIRTYGYDSSSIAQEEGMNARIAEMQAAILRIKLDRFPDWLNRRLRVATAYDERITNSSICKPRCHEAVRHSYHQYVVRTTNRRSLIETLRRRDIGFGIHYPVPVHRMPAYAALARSVSLPVTERACEEILSLPMHEALEDEDVEKVAAALNEFDKVVTDSEV